MENENIEKQEFFKTYLGIKNKNVLSSLGRTNGVCLEGER